MYTGRMNTQSACQVPLLITMVLIIIVNGQSYFPLSIFDSQPSIKGLRWDKDLNFVYTYTRIIIIIQGCATGAMALHVAPHLPLKRQGTYLQRQCYRRAARNDWAGCSCARTQTDARTNKGIILARGRSLYYFRAHVLGPPYTRSSRRTMARTYV